MLPFQFVWAVMWAYLAATLFWAYFRTGLKMLLTLSVYIDEQYDEHYHEFSEDTWWPSRPQRWWIDASAYLFRTGAPGGFNPLGVLGAHTHRDGLNARLWIAFIAVFLAIWTYGWERGYEFNMYGINPNAERNA